MKITGHATTAATQEMLGRVSLVLALFRAAGVQGSFPPVLSVLAWWY